MRELSSRELINKHKDKDFIVLGAAPSLADVDLYLPEDVITIGANRILQHPYFVPDYVMLCDRLPYQIDYNKGVYHEHVDETTYLVSTTLYDPKIQCRGYHVLPKPDFDFYPWRVGLRRHPINLDTFDELLCSFATIPGPMIQAAVIMGARRIGVLGVDLQAPLKGNAHFYEEGKGEEEIVRKPLPNGMASIAPDGCLERFEDLKEMLKERKIPIHNLSPVADSPFSSVFGNTPLEEFLKWTP